jgi:hypothetical protein
MGATMKVGLLSILILFLTGNTLWAEASIRWAKVGEWDVRVDKTLDYGCFMITGYSRGTILRIGMNNKQKNGYLLLANDAWRSVEVGKEYKLRLQFDDENPWVGTFTGISLGTTTSLLTSFSNTQVWREFAAKHKLSVQYKQSAVTSLPLTGTFAAMRSLITCQDKINEAVNNQPAQRTDPFANGTARPISSDPFRH